MSSKKTLDEVIEKIDKRKKEIEANPDNNRFYEIVSTQKIRDTYKGTEHDGLVDKDLLKTMNFLHESRIRLKKICVEQERTINTLTTAVNGLLAIYKLRQEDIYLYDDEWWD